MWNKNLPQHTSDSHDTIQQNLASRAAVMLDVRSEEERDEGFLADSIAIPVDALQQLVAENGGLEQLPKDKIVYCH